MVQESLESYEELDETLEASIVNKLMNRWATLVLVVMVIPYWVIWGIGESSLAFVLKIIGGYMLFILLHELLHVFGYIVIGRAKIGEVKLGLLWKHLMPYAHCKVALKINHYRIALVLPLILGVFPSLYAYLFGSGYWMIIGIFMTAGALGDLLILWTLRE
ncbi:DUF3267 domain-containing protein [Sutcliffiella deserti]|uniref:DUF3267 domain-containing protein n=1 Tax=Sutcliffiella deserti TaxID=2875501 RepID=UPI001CBC730B|nr:DUF3267 domain-containing protein [Sutcliffiella deserti]